MMFLTTLVVCSLATCALTLVGMFAASDLKDMADLELEAVLNFGSEG